MWEVSTRRRSSKFNFCQFLDFPFLGSEKQQGVRAGWPVRAASHVHFVVAELCCGTPYQLPAQRWELAGKAQRQSS